MDNSYKTPQKHRKSEINPNLAPVEAQMNFGSNLMKEIHSYQSIIEHKKIDIRSLKKSSISSDNSRYYQQFANQLENENKHNSNKMHKHKRKHSSLMEIHDKSRHQQLNHILDSADIPRPNESGIQLSQNNLSGVMNKKKEYSHGEGIKQSPTENSSSLDCKKKRSNVRNQTNSNPKIPLLFLKNDRKLIMLENQSFAKAKNITTLIGNNNNDKTRQEESQLKTEANHLRNSAYNPPINEKMIVSHFTPHPKDRKRDKKYNSTPKFEHTTNNYFPNDNNLKKNKEIFINEYEEKKTKSANTLLLLNQKAKNQILKENITNTNIKNNNVPFHANNNKDLRDPYNTPINNDKIANIKTPLVICDIPQPKKKKNFILCCLPMN